MNPAKHTNILIETLDEGDRSAYKKETKGKSQNVLK